MTRPPARLASCEGLSSFEIRMRSYFPHSSTRVFRAPVPSHGAPHWRDPDPKVQRDGLIHGIRMCIVSTTLIETIVVAHLYLITCILAYVLGRLLLGDCYGNVSHLTMWRGLFPMRYVPLTLKIYAVFDLCLAELYAMCRIAQCNMIGVARRRRGWVTSGAWIWDLIAVYRLNHPNITEGKPF